MARTLVASDNFNRASLGTDWTQLRPGSATITIVSSTSFTATGSFQTPARWNGAGTFSNDQYSKCVVGGLNNNGTSNVVGVCVRASADIDANRDLYMLIVIDSSATNRSWQLNKVVNGTLTTITSGTAAIANGDTLALEVQGTTLRAYHNDAQLGTDQTDSALSTGKPGIVASNTLVRGDDWEGGNVAATAGIPKTTKFTLLGVG